MVEPGHVTGQLALLSSRPVRALRNRVDTLADGMWSGSFGEDTMTETINGTFTGARRM